MRAATTTVTAFRVALLAAIPGVPGVTPLAAQGTITARAAPRASGCAELAAVPTSRLANTPEGRSVVRMQRELDVIAQMAQRGEQQAELRGIVTMQKGVDSLMQIIVRQMRDGEAHDVMVFSTDSARRTSAEHRAVRDRLEAQLRELQPKIAALYDAGGNRVMFRAAPTGWIGVRMSGSFVREASTEGLTTRYCDDYPVIEAVDAGSPAEKSGLQAGDTLIAFNNRDVLSQPIVHAQVFVPGQTLRARVRRAGKMRDVTMVVGEPRGGEARFEFRGTGGGFLGCPGGTACERISLSDSVFTMRFMAPEVAGTLAPSRTNVVVSGTAPMTGAPPVPVVGMYVREGGATMVGGAQVTVMSVELAQTLGLEQGLLVLRVLTGTPLADAGLRAGDVIRQVNGVAALDLAVLQKAFSAATREAKLSVVARGQAGRVVTVKW